jgi:hypothetical protein
VLFLIGGSLWFKFGFSNRNSSANNKIIHDDTYNTDDKYEYYDLVKLNSTSALCLDGSHASYYISRQGDSSKILLFFAGGSWCANRDYNKTIESCYIRTKKSLGSSNFQTSSMKNNVGIFSRDERNYFKDWKKVLLSYCDGMGHQGTRK